MDNRRRKPTKAERALARARRLRLKAERKARRRPTAAESRLVGLLNSLPAGEVAE